MALMKIATTENSMNMVMPVPTYSSLPVASEVKPSPAKVRMRIKKQRRVTK